MDELFERVLAEVAAHEDSILNAAIEGEALCPNCKGRGHEGLGLLESDFPCRMCCGRGLLSS
jgi:deoxycytidylate deaminase